MGSSKVADPRSGLEKSANASGASSKLIILAAGADLEDVGVEDIQRALNAGKAQLRQDHGN